MARKQVNMNLDMKVSAPPPPPAPDTASASLPSEAVKTLWGRRIYLTVRLPENKTELAACLDESKEVIAKLKSSSGLVGDELRDCHRRQVYLKHRIEALRLEQKELTAERQQITEDLHRLGAK
jgi:hypothetical protein